MALKEIKELERILKWCKVNKRRLTTNEWGEGYNTALKHITSTVVRRLNKLRKDIK